MNRPRLDVWKWMSQPAIPSKVASVDWVAAASSHGRRFHHDHHDHHYYELTTVVIMREKLRFFVKLSGRMAEIRRTPTLLASM